MVKENFDCTQFITFKLKSNTGININVNAIIDEIFKDSIFKVLSYDEIRNVKKLYFNEYIEEYFFELFYDDFMGEFEDWEFENKPTVLIDDFINSMYTIMNRFNLCKFKIILTSFAEAGITGTECININKKNLSKGLFYMSSYNYDVWTDNLIIEVVNI